MTHPNLSEQLTLQKQGNFLDLVCLQHVLGKTINESDMQKTDANVSVLVGNLSWSGSEDVTETEEFM